MPAARLLSLLVLVLASPVLAADAPRPNVLWITCEDLSPIIGPYGDKFATTPNLDQFAAKSLRYKTCWSNAPVCAPARTTLITGMYATSLGAEHMRSEVPFPKEWKLYPQVLRDAGYYCSNNNKTDYNIVPNGKVWDDTTNKAHWRNRPKDMPFFAIFNTTVTHESQVHKRRPLTHDPAKVRVPAYQPDLPAIREDWAQYYDNVTEMDQFVGERLKELADDGLTEDTIVWFYSDHGCGLPRSKRVPFDSGLHVPFIVHIPEKFKHLRPADYMPGGETPRLVSFVDFGPTALSLCGIKPPENMQGQPFMGPFATEPRQYLFGYRGRMDERVDVVRSVTDGRYVYVRNFMPEKPQGQYLAYMYKQAGIQAWKAAFDKGTLPPEQAAFFLPKPAEALFDLRADRDEVKNLIGDGDSNRLAEQFRNALFQIASDSHDLGLLPECEMLRLSKGQPPVMAFREQNGVLISTRRAAGLFSQGEFHGGPQDSPVAAARYWEILMSSQSFVIGGRPVTAPARNQLSDSQRERLTKGLADEVPCVRIAAAAVIEKLGNDGDRLAVMPVLVDLANPKKHGVATAILALNSLDAIGPLPADVIAQLKANSALPDDTPKRMEEYVPRLIERISERAAAK